MCGQGNPASQHCHPSAVLCSTVQCRLALCFPLSLFPLSASSPDNLLLRICTGIGARRCVASAGRSTSVTILQIRTVLSRQGLVCPLSLDLAKPVLTFQPAFSQVAMHVNLGTQLNGVWHPVEKLYFKVIGSHVFFILRIQCSGL